MPHLSFFLSLDDSKAILTLACIVIIKSMHYNNVVYNFYMYAIRVCYIATSPILYSLFFVMEYLHIQDDCYIHVGRFGVLR